MKIYENHYTLGNGTNHLDKAKYAIRLHSEPEHSVTVHVHVQDLCYDTIWGCVPINVALDVDTIIFNSQNWSEVWLTVWIVI